jgi:hypothetical protein
MPYISPARREDFAPLQKALESQRLDHSGELNYALTIIAQAYLKQHGKTYHILNDIHGAFNCADKEFYRRVTAIHENEKTKENGDVF